MGLSVQPTKNALEEKCLLLTEAAVLKAAAALQQTRILALLLKVIAGQAVWMKKKKLPGAVQLQEKFAAGRLPA